MELWIPFLAALIVGLTSSRVTLVIARGGGHLLYMQPLWRNALGALGTLAIAAVILWGLLYLLWYWVLAAFIAVSLFIVAPIITLETLPLAFDLQPFLNIACAVIAGYLWFAL